MQAQLIKKLRELSGSPIIHCKKALEESSNDLAKAQEWLRLKGISQAHKKLSNSTGAGLVSGMLTPSGGYLLEILCETDFVARTELFQKFSKEMITAWAGSNLAFSAWPSLRLNSFGCLAEEAKLQTISKTQENVIIRRGVKYESDHSSVVGIYLHNTIDPLLGFTGSLVKLACAAQLNDRSPVTDLANKIAMQIVAGKPLFLHKSAVPEEFRAKEKAAIEESLDDKVKSKEKKVVENIVKGKVEKAIEQVCLYDQVFMIDEGAEERVVREVLKNFGDEIKNEVKIEAFSIFACERLDR